MYHSYHVTVIFLGDYMGAQCHACIGGTNVREDLKKLSSPGVHIVVGTPGRVFDMISRRALSKYLYLCSFFSYFFLSFFKTLTLFYFLFLPNWFLSLTFSIGGACDYNLLWA